MDSWHGIAKTAAGELVGLDGPFCQFLEAVIENSPDRLRSRAETFHRIVGGRFPVLPPDTRHVAYNVVPLRVTEGCLYHCRFCRVKDQKEFTTRSGESIIAQIGGLKTFFGPDLVNFNALFLGDNDALGADKDLLLFGVDRAMAELALDGSYMAGCNLFLFGSVDSFLEADMRFFDALGGRNCRTYINIGLESADPETLDAIGKPLTADLVKRAFGKMVEINRRCGAVEMTANFLMDDSLPAGHYPAFLDLVGKGVDQPTGKGTLYLSPLCDTPPTQRTLFYFNQLQAMSRLPVYLYLIQRV